MIKLSPMPVCCFAPEQAHNLIEMMRVANAAERCQPGLYLRSLSEVAAALSADEVKSFGCASTRNWLAHYLSVVLAEKARILNQTT